MPFTAVLKELQRSSMATTASSSATTIASSTSPATGTSTSTSSSTTTTATATATSTISTSNLPTNCTPVTTNNLHSSASCTVNTVNNCSNKVNHHQISPCTSTSLDQTSCKSMTVSNGDLHHQITGNSSSHAHLFHHPPDVHPHHLHHSLTGGVVASSSCLPGTLVVASSTGTSVVPSVVPVAINLQLTPSDLLRSAATAGDFEQVKELCKQSVTIDADAEGRTALHYAAVNGHLQIVKEIINAGAKVNVKDALGFTPLHLAASEGNVELVNLLLKSGALVDAQDDLQGNTALHKAAWKGFSQTVKILMKHKANVCIKNKGGFSALHLSCQQGHNESTRVLLLNRCKPDIRNNYGDSPLHTAARYGHAGVARILISAWCDVNPVNKNGDTPLHITAAMGRRKLTKILLSYGATPSLKNLQGETPMDIALRKSFKEVQEIIANPPPYKERISRASSYNGHMLSGSNSSRREKESSMEGSKSSGRPVGRRDRARLTRSRLAASKSVEFLCERSTGQNNKEQTGPKDIHRKQDTSRPLSSHLHDSSSSSAHPHHLHHHSPYGCPQEPDMEQFKLKIESLPREPLRKGEQYYLDLAGKIRKGPARGAICDCTCHSSNCCSQNSPTDSTDAVTDRIKSLRCT